MFKLHALEQKCAQYFPSGPLTPETYPLVILKDPTTHQHKSISNHEEELNTKFALGRKCPHS